MRLLAAFLVYAASALAALAQSHALVIGNGAYPGAGVLPRVPSDAASVAQALRGRGFTVTALADLDAAGFRLALQEFRTRAAASDVAVVYFAGRSVTVGGRGFLVPVDARLSDARDAGLELIALDEVLRHIGGARALRAVFVDAARPLPPGQIIGAGILPGLPPVTLAPAATMVSYAAAPGVVRPDFPGVPAASYSVVLASVLTKPLTNPLTLLDEVRRGVMTAIPGSNPYVFQNLVAPGTTAPAPAAPPRAYLPAAEATVELQKLLKAQKCYYGAIDGIWGGGSMRGLTTFTRQAGETFAVSRDMSEAQLNAALALIDRHPAVTCPPRPARSSRKKKSDKPRFCPQYGWHKGCPDNY